MGWILHVKRFFAGLLTLVGVLIFLALVVDPTSGAYVLVTVSGVTASYGLGCLLIKDNK